MADSFRTHRMSHIASISSVRADSARNNPCGTERKKAAKAAKKAAKKERKAIAAAGGAAAEAQLAADVAQSKEASELKARYIGKQRENAGGCQSMHRARF